MVEYLIQNRLVDIDGKDFENMNALMQAAIMGHVKCAELLIEWGCDVNCSSASGLSVLHYAVCGGNKKLIELILKKTGQIPDKNLFRLLIQKGCIDTLKLLSKQFVKDGDRIDLSKLCQKYPYNEIKDTIELLRNILETQICNMQTCKELLHEAHEHFSTIIEVQPLLQEVHALFSYYNNLLKNPGEVDCMLSSDSFKLFIEPKLLIWSNERIIDFSQLEYSDDTIGKGAFGSVKKATLDEKHFAVKCVDFARVKASLLVKEAENMLSLHHDNIVEFYGHVHVLLNDEGKPMVHFIMELCKEDLEKHFIQKGPENDRNPDRAACFDSSYQYFLNIAMQIFNGLSYIHSENLIHKDIKLANIMISFDYRIKIADCGLSDVLEGDVEETKERKGTRVYMYQPPEVHQSTCRYSYATDIFSASLVLYELYVGQIYYKTCLLYTSPSPRD